MRYRREITITPEEAISISKCAVTLSEIEWSHRLTELLKRKWFERNSLEWTLSLIVATAFCAGRTQGIRDERKRRTA